MECGCVLQIRVVNAFQDPAIAVALQFKGRASFAAAAGSLPSQRGGIEGAAYRTEEARAANKQTALLA